MSVWESLDALRAFVYRDPSHLAVMRRRREWFVKHAEAFQVLWWIPEGHIPTVQEAEEKLAHLREHGPTPDAFTFSTADLCPALRTQAGEPLGEPRQTPIERPVGHPRMTQSTASEPQVTQRPRPIQGMSDSEGAPRAETSVTTSPCQPCLIF